MSILMLFYVKVVGVFEERNSKMWHLIYYTNAWIEEIEKLTDIRIERNKRTNSMVKIVTENYIKPLPYSDKPDFVFSEMISRSNWANSHHVINTNFPITVVVPI